MWCTGPGIGIGARRRAAAATACSDADPHDAAPSATARSATITAMSRVAARMMLESEDIHRVSWSGEFLDVLHRADNAERGVGVVGGDRRERDCAHPATDAGVDS